MKLTVLADNNTYIDKYYYGEPALSYYIETEGKRILFDVGYSDVAVRNAEKMGIDLNNLDFIVISHGHNDHTGGLRYIFNKFNTAETVLISHPACFDTKLLGKDAIGSPYSAGEIGSFVKWHPSAEPVNITDRLIFLGRIPRTNDFEAKKPIGYIKKDNEILADDYIIDDSAIIYRSDNGIFIITGCSHSGICNITEYAKKVCGGSKILGIIGGFHLFNNLDRIEKTADYFVSSGVGTIYPCHCVSLKAKAEMMKRLDVKEVGVSMKLEIE